MSAWLRLVQESPFYPPDPVPLLSSWAIAWVPLNAGIAVLRALRRRGPSKSRSRVKEMLEMDAVVPLLGPLMTAFFGVLAVGLWAIHDLLTGKVTDIPGWMAEWQRTRGPTVLLGSFGISFVLVMLSTAVAPSLLAAPERPLRTLAALAVQTALLLPSLRVSGSDLVSLEALLGSYLGAGTFLSSVSALTLHFASRYLIPWLGGSLVALLVSGAAGALHAVSRRDRGDGGASGSAQRGDVPGPSERGAAQSSPERTPIASSRPLTLLT